MDLIKWNIQRNYNVLTYTGFLLQMRSQIDGTIEVLEELQFFGDSLPLQQLKQFLQKILFQSRFQDEFMIQSQIGKGSFARVFSARHRETNQKIAVKCFQKGPEQKSKMACIFKEIEMLKQIGEHPNLINIIGFYEGEKTFYIVMSIFEGPSLFQHIKFRSKNKELTQKEIKTIIRQILKGIEHYSSFGIMHRDIKPANIIFKSSNSLDEVAIVDFGLAEYENAINCSFPKCGTPGYIAPEVANFVEEEHTFYTSKCDIFSVGVVFHILYFGEHLFLTSHLKEMILLNKQCEIDYDQEFYQDNPQLDIQFLKGLLAINPKERFSATEALAHPYLNEKFEKENLILDSPIKVKSTSRVYSKGDGALASQKEQNKNQDQENLLKFGAATSLIESQEVITSLIFNKQPLFQQNKKQPSASKISSSQNPDKIATDDQEQQNSSPKHQFSFPVLGSAYLSQSNSNNDSSPNKQQLDKYFVESSGQNEYPNHEQKLSNLNQVEEVDETCSTPIIKQLRNNEKIKVITNGYCSKFKSDEYCPGVPLKPTSSLEKFDQEYYDSLKQDSPILFSNFYIQFDYLKNENQKKYLSKDEINEEQEEGKGDNKQKKIDNDKVTEGQVKQQIVITNPLNQQPVQNHNHKDEFPPSFPSYANMVEDK